MKILILRFSSIGDIVLTTPVIRTLKTQLEDAEIHYATKAAYASILTSNPYIDKLHLLDNSLGQLISALKKERFDVIIDLHNNLRTRRVTWSLVVKTYRFEKINVAKWLMVNFKWNRLPNKHIVDRYMDTTSALGVKMDSLGLDYFIPEKDEVELEWLPETHRQGYAVFVIGGKFPTKRLPVERMIELCDRINKPIILLGGKEDIENANRIEDFFRRPEGNEEVEEVLIELGKKALIYNACGKFNFNQSASIVKQAQWVFTHDTGLMHVAAAFKKKVYSIWGNTIPAFGMYPYRTKFIVFENNKIKCRPCSKIGFQKCPKGHFKCMKEVVFDFYLPD
ncbi:MAG: glycosyltransferase family 9 protein [Cyclobacteriaceae bacterium]|nr:glycosyltransferase family 9 protein [Cyclobacteriaceae bacterium SS2]